jgi:hypothetical protein
MTPSAWIALAALAVVLLAHIIAVVIHLTRLDERVKAVEGICKEFREVRDTVTRLDERFARFEGTMNRMDATLSGLNGLKWLKGLADVADPYEPDPLSAVVAPRRRPRP